MSDILKAFMENEAAIKRYLKRLTSTGQSVDDYAQETFLKGFAAEIRQPIKEPKAFLFKIAKNVVLTDVRKNKRSLSSYAVHHDDLTLVLDEKQVAPEDWLDSRRKLALFSMAVAQLTPLCRKAFLLRRIDGLQYKQIANRMDISVSTVEKHVANGLMKCNRYLRKQGYDPSEFGATLKAARKESTSQIQPRVKPDE